MVLTNGLLFEALLSVSDDANNDGLQSAHLAFVGSPGWVLASWGACRPVPANLRANPIPTRAEPEAEVIKAQQLLQGISAPSFDQLQDRSQIEVGAYILLAGTQEPYFIQNYTFMGNDIF